MLGELPDRVGSPNRLTESKPSGHLSLLVFDFYVFVIILSLLWSFCPSVVYCVSVVAGLSEDDVMLMKCIQDEEKLKCCWKYLR